MKISEKWLRQWANPNITTDQLCQKMTMAGLELEGIEPVCCIQGVIVAKVKTVEKHPDADKLSLCQVDTGSEILPIVCGGKNVRQGLVVALAVVGAQLPGITIKKAKVRGLESLGMLCSEVELGLADSADGIMELAANAPIGMDFIDYYDLNDHVLDFSITPNRGDATSVKGLAREIHALTACPINPVSVDAVKPSTSEQLNVEIQSDSCVRYSCRMLKGIDNTVATPIWLAERLRRSGIRPISPVVDVTNYVMLELGQPMHAFDAAVLQGNISVRPAQKSEKLLLLNDQEIELDEQALVIADQHKVLALAGIMGGLDSGVKIDSCDVLLESACFDPEAVARSARHYLLHSDSSYRFERGVDFTIQEQALERASQLLLEIVGGKVGPVVMAQGRPVKVQLITLRKNYLKQALGFSIDDEKVRGILRSLGFEVKVTDMGWQVQTLPYRYDVTMEMDLIEEVLRVYGYDLIPERLPVMDISNHEKMTSALSVRPLQRCLQSRAYREIISYSFVSEKIEKLLGNTNVMKLINPVSKELSVMRSRMLSGLIPTLQYNVNRQQDRVRLFEYGLCFHEQEELTQKPYIAGVVCGSAMPEQWGEGGRQVDFYDIKNDVEQLLAIHLDCSQLQYKATTASVYHPGQAAEIYYKEQMLGYVGALHPEIGKKLKLKTRLYAFELSLDAVNAHKKYNYQPVSKYPEMRRDLAFYVDEGVSFDQIKSVIRGAQYELIKDVFIFDIYQGENVPDGKKSCAIALILKHYSRTLIDEEVNNVIEQVVQSLVSECKAQLRD